MYARSLFLFYAAFKQTKKPKLDRQTTLHRGGFPFTWPDNYGLESDSASRFFGKYFLNALLTGMLYLEMLQIFFGLNIWGHLITKKKYFQQDGA